MVGAVAACAAASSVFAAGFGPANHAATLGQGLDFSVPMRLDAGDVLNAECVSAEVTLGDRKLASGQVRVAVEPTGVEQARIRVQTTVSIDEPVVAVQLSAGCNAKISRRFVLLADPPLFANPTPVVPAFAANPVDAGAAQAAGATPVGGAVGAVPGALPSAGGSTASEARSSTPEGTAARPQTPSRMRAAQRRQARTGDRAVARAGAGALPGAAPARPGRRTAVATAAAAPAGRLQLDLTPTALAAQATLPGPTPQPTMADTTGLAVQQALEAVAQAASSARVAASAAAEAQLRIGALERGSEELRGQLQAEREQNRQLRQRLDSGGEPGRWTLPLLAAAGVLGLLAVWLAWRLAIAQRMQQQAWQRAAVASRAGPETAAPSSASMTEPTTGRQRTSPTPFVASASPYGPHGDTAGPDSQPRTRPPSTPAWPPAADSQGHTQVPITVALPARPARDLRDAETTPYDAVARTEPMPAGTRPGESSPRDVSIEELLDLEQQAEFFIVLGQDEAAIELLAEHLRNTGGGSPLPYLKLLEIYHRRGDREDYERTRRRFNHRFNAYAPEWGAELTTGRTLEDYGGVVPRLMQVWPRPLDAMAELEALLFRKSRGELFELPAYREVLFLYSLARDLLDREAADTTNVDLLLPLSDGGEFSTTSPAPFMKLDHDAVPSRPGELDERTDRLDRVDRATAPLDFDLSSGPDRPGSIFDTLDEPPARKP